MSSHSRALQMTCELGTSRSALTVKCPPKQPVAAELVPGEPDHRPPGQVVMVVEAWRQPGHNEGTSLREDAGYDEKC
jgi:hypothetical protein